MGKSRLLVCFFVITGAVECLAWHCDDPEYYCSDACDKLANCENGWLEDEGEQPMDDSQFDLYIDKCQEECGGGDGSAESDIECILDATCNELLDGECRD